MNRRLSEFLLQDQEPLHSVALGDEYQEHLPPRGQPFYIMFVLGAAKPSTRIFLDKDIALRHATEFTRAVHQPVHVMRVIATVQVEPDPVEVINYERSLGDGRPAG